MPNRYRLYFDGGQRKTKIFYGYVLYENDDIIEKNGGEHDDPVLSNNVAEYMALCAGLVAALKKGITEIEVFGDSKLVIEQMLENYRTKANTMKPCFCMAKILEKQFTKITFTWIPRKENYIADRETR